MSQPSPEATGTDVPRPLTSTEASALADSVVTRQSNVTAELLAGHLEGLPSVDDVQQIVDQALATQARQTDASLREHARLTSAALEALGVRLMRIDAQGRQHTENTQRITQGPLFAAIRELGLTARHGTGAARRGRSSLNTQALIWAVVFGAIGLLVSLLWANSYTTPSVPVAGSGHFLDLTFTEGFWLKALMVVVSTALMTACGSWFGRSITDRDQLTADNNDVEARP